MYRIVHLHFWTDPKVRKLSTNGRLLFLYLLTSPYSDICGIYNQSFLSASEQTGLSTGQTMEAFRELANLQLVTFDLEGQVVWVINMYRYKGNKGKWIDRHTARHLDQVHSRQLVAEFRREYKIPILPLKGVRR